MKDRELERKIKQKRMSGQEKGNIVKDLVQSEPTFDNKFCEVS